MYSIENFRLRQGDCIDLMKGIPDKSIDLILCDLPYGTTSCKWDSVIEFDSLWSEYKRIRKENGVIVLFSAQPFTTALIYSNINEYKYSWYWLKNNVTGFTFAKYQPMRRVEDINVFYKKGGMYYPQGLREVEKKILRTRTSNKETIYKEQTLSKPYIQKYTGYPNNVLEYKKESKCVHPTQKPVDLLEYLIKTYTNENMIVLDNCMGSGSTGVACANTGRRFIGFELDKGYFEIARNRIAEAYKLKKQ